jgi:hypothetical protein
LTLFLPIYSLLPELTQIWSYNVCSLCGGRDITLRVHKFEVNQYVKKTKLDILAFVEYHLSSPQFPDPTPHRSKFLILHSSL